MALQIAKIGGVNNIDYEHQRIIQELLSIGISPTYEKSADKAKLEAEKVKLVEKISNKCSTSEKEPKPEFKDVIVAYQPDGNRVKLEEERLGAMTLAELNKIYFGL